LFPGLNLIHVSSKRDLGFKQNPKLKKLMDFINPRIGTITAPSKSILEQMSNKYGNNIKTYLIPNGTDLSINKPVTNDTKQAARQKLSLPVNKNIIGIVGSLSQVKGHKYLLEAFSDFNKKSENEWYLVIIGSGTLELSLRTIVKKLKIENLVCFAGYQKEIYNWLVSLDIVVSSSTSEGLSNALIEAAACGLPIIATDVGGNPEIVKNDYNGMLIQAADPDAICDALITFDRDTTQLEKMGTNSRMIAEECFSIDSMVSKLESLYLKLSDENR
jgi:glycosyltransferase involved in cell wall biosynthesis